MLKPLLSALVVSALVVGGCFAIAEASASKGVALQTVVPDPPAPQLHPAPPIHHQMNALDHRTKFDMILYTGHFGPGETAAVKSQLDAIALTLRAGK
jgi:hypothetical protein